MFYQVLEINGVTAVKDGDIYKIVPLKDVSPPAHHEPEHHPKQVPPEERVIIQVILWPPWQPRK
ncbi:MAG: hypothetical protein R2860_07405 [Desulfobacterales bacterium]